MASLFDKDRGEKAPVGPYSRERIEQEISHLRKGAGTRHASAHGRGLRAVWPAVLTLLILLGLFILDPVEHGLRRGQAIRAYLYLHHFGSDEKAGKILATGVFTPREIELLDQRRGAFESYYPGPVQAGRTADAIASYFKGVSFLQAGAYDQLDALGKLRYQLFVRWGLRPPRQWSFLDPAIRD